MRALTGRRTVVLLTLLGAGLVLLAGTRTWARVSIDGAFPGLSEMTVAGRRSAPETLAIALAAAAAAVVLATSGRIVRFLVAAGLVTGGAVVLVSAVRAARDTDGAVATAIQDSLRVFTDRNQPGGVFDSSGPVVSMSIWPWAAAVGGGLIAVSGLLALVGGRSWSGPTQRYERASASGPVSADSTGSAASIPVRTSSTNAASASWDALSRGEDPTSSPEDRT